MSKRDKRKAKQKAAKSQRAQRFSPVKSQARNPDVASSLMRAGALIDGDKPDEALEILEPLLEEHTSPELLGAAAIAYVGVGDLWSAITCFEQIQKYGLDPSVWATMATIYVQLGMNFYALQALRNALKGMSGDDEDRPILQLMQETLQESIDELVTSLDIPVSQAETGLRHHDDAQRAASQNNFQAAIDANRRAIRFLGKWPPIHNNLAQALLYNGQPAEALAATRAVLADEPNNVHALSNAIKILTWGGKNDEAQELWEQLLQIEPANALERFKLSEAAAVMNADESVYQLLKPLVEAEMGDDYQLDPQLLYRFAVAEANLGDRKSALQHLQELGEDDPIVQPIIYALRAKQPGIGWATRYSYFSVSELLPVSAFDAMSGLIEQVEELDEKQFRKRLNRMLEQYPQLVLVAKQILWEQMEGEYAVGILNMIASPAAYDALREFAFSQAGSDEDRMQALTLLQEAGVLDTSQPVRIWRDGKWHDIQLASFDVSDEPEATYPPTVIKLYERAINAHNEERFDEAERLYKQILVLEPRAADVYYNLGVIYSEQNREQEAEILFRKSIELRPLYAMPRCQLANDLLDKQDIAAAKEILLPILQAKHLSTIEMSTYMYVQARILTIEEEYAKARSMLESLLKMAPDFAPAQALLERIKMLEMFGAGLKGFVDNMRRRYEKRRSAMQSKLSGADITVDMALNLYHRELQQSMARHILPHGGWSAFKKKQLHEALAQALPNPGTLQHILSNLSDEERGALRSVLASGGLMKWEEFVEQYDDDLDESPDWQYHEPATLMGRLRQRALLAITTVDKQVMVVVPTELRKPLAELLG
jgi:tetratricopeptide (TPR) repeat protein